MLASDCPTANGVRMGPSTGRVRHLPGDPGQSAGPAGVAIGEPGMSFILGFLARGWRKAL